MKVKLLGLNDILGEVSPIHIPLSEIENGMAKLFHDFESYTNEEGFKEWFVEISPDIEFRVSFDKSIGGFSVRGNTRKSVNHGRIVIYKYFDSIYNGLIERVRKRWDPVALEVSQI